MTVAVKTDEKSEFHAALEFLRPLSRTQLKMIFTDLPAASLTDTVGEYSAVLLNQGDGISDSVTRWAFQMHGPWIGKAFRPLSQKRGEGYNLFGDDAAPRCELTMDTHIGPSAFASGHSLILDYSHRNRGLIRWLLGELRQLDATTLLGMGVFGPRGNRLSQFQRVIPFVLTGPIGDYRLGRQTVTSPFEASRGAPS